jgi:hypothetical protein
LAAEATEAAKETPGSINTKPVQQCLTPLRDLGIDHISLGQPPCDPEKVLVTIALLFSNSPDHCGRALCPPV